MRILCAYVRDEAVDEQMVKVRRLRVCVSVCMWVLTLPVLYGGLVLLYHGLCCSGEGHGSSAVPMMHQVAGYHTKENIQHKIRDSMSSCPLLIIFGVHAMHQYFFVSMFRSVF